MTPTSLPTTDAFKASWQGINHLALVTATWTTPTFALISRPPTAECSSSTTTYRR
jgi:hypothetical protein